MPASFFERLKGKKEPIPPRQATMDKDETVSEGRRRFLKNAGLLALGTAVGERATETVLKKVFKTSPQDELKKPVAKVAIHKEKHTTVRQVAPVEVSPSEEHTPAPTAEVVKENSPLDAYSFLDGEAHPITVSTGELAGNTFSDLYAAYLGIPSGTVVPKTLHVDFKENLATLWREKFDLPERSHNEHDLRRQLQFLKEHHNLMNLAEYLYLSYDVEKSNTTTLSAYRNDISQAVDNARAVFDATLSGTLDSSAHKDIFSERQTFLMKEMGDSLTADTLLSISLTELMPSNDGRTNVQVFGFLLGNAGVDFVDRIPSVHDMLESFGPYQITPSALGEKSAGSWAAQVLNALPDGFMPRSVDGLLQDKEHTAAYALAMLNIVQFVGTRNSAQLRCLSDVMRTLPPQQRAQAILSFVATAHHSPKDAYDSFDAFVWSLYVNHAQSFTDDDMLRHIHNVDLRAYTQKAIANHQFLTANSI